MAEGFLVDDVQYNLRIDISTGRTSTGLSIGIVGLLLEIGNGIDRIAVEDRVAASVQQPQTVEQLIDIARRLMDIDNNQFVLESLLFKQVDDFLCIS